MKSPRLNRIEKTLNTRQPDLTVLMEDVHKAQNLSAIVRSCDAVGVPMVHTVASKPAVRRYQNCAAGSNRWVDIRIHGTIHDAAVTMRQSGMQIVAADLNSEAVDFRELDYTIPTVFLLGNELDGVSAEARSIADHSVTIPMVGMIASLNVSVAAAMLLYEAFRQRDTAGLYDKRRIADDVFVTKRFEWLHPKLAAYCRKHGLPYPGLESDGQIIGNLTGNQSERVERVRKTAGELKLDL